MALTISRLLLIAVLAAAAAVPVVTEPTMWHPRSLGEMKDSAQLEQRLFSSSPPSCKLVLFSHLEKTGGTTIRKLFLDQPEQSSFYYMTYDCTFCVPGTERFLPYLKEGRVPELLLQKGRVFVEVHGLNQDIAEVIRALRPILSDMPGCSFFAFTHARDPFMFYRSNLHDSFTHSIMKHHYQRLFGRWRKGSLYKDPGPHHNVSTFAMDMTDLETRSMVAQYAGGSKELKHAAEDFSQQGATPEMLQAALEFLELQDYVGITALGPEHMVVLQEHTGIMLLSKGASLCHKNDHRRAKEQGYEEAEQLWLSKVVGASTADQQLWQKAGEKMRSVIEKVPNFSDRCDAFVKLYGTIECTAGAREKLPAALEEVVARHERHRLASRL